MLRASDNKNGINIVYLAETGVTLQHLNPSIL